MKKSASGFTLVELLIVIVVIAILAAITLVAYNGIQTRAHASTAQNDAEQLSKLLALSNVNNGNYPTDLSTVNNGGPMPSGDGTTYVYHQQNGGANYCATITNSTSSYTISDTRSSPAAGGCPGDGQGGQSAITNLADGANATAFLGNGRFGFRNDRYGADEAYSLLSGVATPVSTVTTAARITWKTTNGSSRGFDIGNNPDVTGTGGYPIAPGSYVFSVYARANFASSSNSGVTYCKFMDSSGTAVGSQTSTGATLSSSWQRYSLSFTTPASAAYLHCSIRLQSGATASVGDTLDATCLMLTSGSTMYNYADGNSPSWIWNGAANSSTSTGPAQ